MRPIATAPPPTAPPIMAPLLDEPPPPPPEEEEVAGAGVGVIGTGVVVTVVGAGEEELVDTAVVVDVGTDTVDLVVEAAADAVWTTATAPGVKLRRPEESVLCTTQKFPVPHPTKVYGLVSSVDQ